MAKILAVDDDKAILTMIRRILEKDGHRVTVYADSGAVEQMELSGFDLILLDVMMPGPAAAGPPAGPAPQTASPAGGR